MWEHTSLFRIYFCVCIKLIQLVIAKGLPNVVIGTPNRDVCWQNGAQAMYMVEPFSVQWYSK